MDDGSSAEVQVDALLRFARLLTGDRQLAEDLVQDVLVQLLRRRDRLEEIDSLDRYARRMVVNGYLSWRRKWSRIVPTYPPPETALTADPMKSVDLRDELRGALERLTRRQRAAIVLRYYLDLSDTQAAAELDCSVTTVRSHISRGLAALRINLNDTAGSEKGLP